MSSDLPPKQIDESWINKENIVLTLKTSSQLYLPDITCKNPQFTFARPGASSYVVLRHLTPRLRVSTNVFMSGKIVITGGKTVFDTFPCIFVTLRKIRDTLGIKGYHGTSLSLRNIVMTVTLPMRIDIDALFRSKKTLVHLDRKKFPGAIMSLPDQTPTANIFDSGKFVLPGPATKKYALECVSWVYDQVRPYLFKGKGRVRGKGKGRGKNNASNTEDREESDPDTIYGSEDEDELALQRLEQEICEMENLL